MTEKEPVKRKRGRPRNPVPKKEERELLDMKKKMVEMQEKMDALMDSNSGADSDVGSLQQDTYIDVISLCNHTLNLTIRQGETITFRRFGEQKRVLYSDLVKIIENSRSFMEKGHFYIANKEVIRKHGLDDLYKTILTKDRLLKIFSSDADLSVQIFEEANDSQKATIVDIAIDRINDDVGMDLNLAARLTLASGVDIIEKADESKRVFSKENV